MTMSSSFQVMRHARRTASGPQSADRNVSGTDERVSSRPSPSAPGSVTGTAFETAASSPSGTGSPQDFHRRGLLRRFLHRAGRRFVPPRAAVSLVIAFVACATMAPEALAQTPGVNISGGGITVTEGDTVTYTVTADPAPKKDLTVNVAVIDYADYLAPSEEGNKTVVIPAGETSADYTVRTDDDGVLCTR